MSRTGRKHGGTGIYHVMLRGINRQGVFEEAGRLSGGMELKTSPCDSYKKVTRQQIYGMPTGSVIA